VWPNTWLEPPSLVSMSTWLGSCTCGAVLEEQDAQARPIAAAHRSYVAFSNFAGPTGGGYEATAGESTVQSPDGQVTARASGAPADIAPAWLSEPALVCGGQAADGCYARGSSDRGPDCGRTAVPLVVQGGSECRVDLRFCVGLEVAVP